MRKICVVVGSRANYSSIKSVLTALNKHTDLQLQLIATASAVLDRYGQVDSLMEKDGFVITERLNILIEGETLTTMAKSTGLGLIELSSSFERLAPDIVITVGDRFETMATTLAAAYMNIPIAHTMGGEVTGTIDESIRHAVTKFAHIHFPASRDAANRIIRLGERASMVFQVGCPRIDLIAEVLEDQGYEHDRLLTSSGVGDQVDTSKPFLIVSQHPVTTEYGNGEEEINETLEAVKDSGLQAIILWPNSDAGSEDISRGMRKWREKGLANNMRFYKNLPVNDYIKLMKRTCCLIGNSSSGIREGAFMGTPVVNIGNRQNGRERGKNVIDVKPVKNKILDGITFQLKNGRYEKDDIYGDGKAGVHIADILAKLGPIDIQKRITY